jgi:predicted GIY-YIG superfamily endonuclease
MIVRQYYLYILASRPGGAIYVGVTNDLIKRVYQHKNKLVKGFTQQYGIDWFISKSIRPRATPSSAKRISSTGREPGRRD